MSALARFETRWGADAVEICPQSSGSGPYIAVTTYALEEQGTRAGCLHLLTVEPDETFGHLRELARLDTCGLLDTRWRPRHGTEEAEATLLCAGADGSVLGIQLLNDGGLSVGFF